MSRNADFTPTRGNYTSLTPFRYWCQKVLPLVYDDSLSYYELLCKVVDYLNKTMEDTETLNDDVTNLYTAYQQLQEWVNNYYESADFEQAIDDGLDRMAESGQLTTLINAIIAPQLPDIVDLLLPDTVASQLPDEVSSQIGGTVANQLPNVVSNQIGGTVATQLPNVVSNQIGGVVENQLPNVVSDQINDVVAEKIVDPVEDWLETNVGTGNAIDRTLSIVGAAADAAFTGARLETLDDMLGYEHVSDTGSFITTANPFAFNYEIINDNGVFSDQGTHTYKMLVIPVNTGDKYCINAHKISVANVSENHFAVTYAFCAKHIGDPQTDIPYYLPTTYGRDDADNLIVTAPEIVIPTGQSYDETTGYLVVITANIEDPVYKVTDSVAKESEITELKDDLSDTIGIHEVALLDNHSINNGASSTAVIPSNIQTENGYACCCVECQEGDVFVITGRGGNTTRLWSFSDANGSVLSISDRIADADKLEITAPKNANYFASNFNKNYTPYWVNKGAYTDKTLTIDGKPADAKETGDRIKDVSDDLMAIGFIIPKIAGWIDNKYISRDDGTEQSNTSYHATDFIAINPKLGNIVLTSTNAGTYDTNYNVWYDKDKHFISNFSYTRNGENTITPPSNARYFRLSCNKTVVLTLTVPYADKTLVDLLPENTETGNYVITSALRKENLIVEKLAGTLTYSQSFCMFDGKYYSTNGTNISEQDGSFTELRNAVVTVGHGNALQLGHNGKAYASGWNDNKVYIVDLATLTVEDNITLPTTGYTTCAIDDLKGIAYIFQRDTYPDNEAPYNFIAYDYVNAQTLYTRKTTPFAAMQACDIFNDSIIVVNGLGSTAAPNHCKVYDINGVVTGQYVLPDIISAGEPEGVFFDRSTCDIYMSKENRDIYKITH